MTQPRFCTQCAYRLELNVPAGDDRPRHICTQCGHVHYLNPQLVVGCVVEWEGQVLLCRRAIDPQRGKWTVPAGYLEKGETVAEGAQREAFEEAQARVEIIAPYVLLDLTFVSQVYLMFRSRLVDGSFAAGPESLEVRLFSEDDIPWDDLAFTSVERTLRLYFADSISGQYPFHTGHVTR